MSPLHTHALTFDSDPYSVTSFVDRFLIQMEVEKHSRFHRNSSRRSLLGIGWILIKLRTMRTTHKSLLSSTLRAKPLTASWHCTRAHQT